MANGSSLKCLLYPTHLLGAKGNKFLAEILINRWQWAETLCNPLFFPLLFFSLMLVYPISSVRENISSSKRFLFDLFPNSVRQFKAVCLFFFPIFLVYHSSLGYILKKKKFSGFRETITQHCYNHIY